jgi:hypothetical protein
MNLARFDVDDIHELRVQMAEKYRNMPKEEAEADFRRQVESARRAIEEIRGNVAQPNS